jgi:hypothetical protein
MNIWRTPSCATPPIPNGEKFILRCYVASRYVEPHVNDRLRAHTAERRSGRCLPCPLVGLSPAFRRLLRRFVTEAALICRLAARRRDPRDRARSWIHHTDRGRSLRGWYRRTWFRYRLVFAVVTVAALIGVLALVALLIDARWVGLGVQAVLLTAVLARRLAGSVRRWSKPPPPPPSTPPDRLGVDALRDHRRHRSVRSEPPARSRSVTDH